MALMHEHKWTTAPHDGWNVETVIIDYANEQIKQVWKKEHGHQTDGVDEQPPHEEPQLDEQHESKKQKGTAMKRPAVMKVKAAKKGIKETAKKVIKVKAAKKVIKVKKAKAAKKVIKKTAKNVIKKTVKKAKAAAPM